MLSTGVLPRTNTVQEPQETGQGGSASALGGCGLEDARLVLQGAPRAPPQERWARLPLGAELCSFLARNRGTFMHPLPAGGGSQPCFLFIPCCWIQWAETLPPGPLRRHRRPFSTGAPAGGESWRGRGQGGHKDPIVCRPESQQGLGSGGRSQPEPAGRLWGEVQGRLRPAGAG